MWKIGRYSPCFQDRERPDLVKASMPQLSLPTVGNTRPSVDSGGKRPRPAMFANEYRRQSRSCGQISRSGPSHTAAKTMTSPSRLGHDACELANGESAKTITPTIGPRRVSQSQPIRFLQRVRCSTTKRPYRGAPSPAHPSALSSRFRHEETLPDRRSREPPGRTVFSDNRLGSMTSWTSSWAKSLHPQASLLWPVTHPRLSLRRS